MNCPACAANLRRPGVPEFLRVLLSFQEQLSLIMTLAVAYSSHVYGKGRGTVCMVSHNTWFSAGSASNKKKTVQWHIVK
jgi:hypothetical protein